PGGVRGRGVAVARGGRPGGGVRDRRGQGAASPAPRRPGPHQRALGRAGRAAALRHPPRGDRCPRALRGRPTAPRRRPDRRAGTPGFAAPEVWSRGEYTPAADRYGFAALGFYTLFGTPPPADEAEIAEQLLDHPFLLGTPPWQAEQILRGFSADPAARPDVVE